VAHREPGVRSPGGHLGGTVSPALGDRARLRSPGRDRHGAVTGRVRTLLVAEEESVWGSLDRATGSIRRHDGEKGSEDADGLDDIAEEAYKRGGDVYVVPRAVMPVQGPIAALYRF